MPDENLDRAFPIKVDLPNPPVKDAVRQSVDVANRIGIPVHVEINGVMVWVYPGDNAELLAVEHPRKALAGSAIGPIILVRESA